MQYNTHIPVVVEPNQLVLGDCLEVIANIPDSSIDLVLTSPPYDDMRTYGERYNGFNFKEIAISLKRVLREGGTIVWNVGDQVVNGSETGNSFRQALFFMDVCNLNLHDTMIWQKSNFSNPSSNRYHQTFEYVFILTKGKIKTFNPIKDRPNVYANKMGNYGKNTVTQKDGNKKIRPRKVNTEFGMRHNVWSMPTAGQDGTAKKYGHPAMFSEQFAADHILSWSNPDDIVLDPFLGSGTTGAMALKTGRKFIGIEQEVEYFEIAKNRISSINNKN